MVLIFIFAPSILVCIKIKKYSIYFSRCQDWRLSYILKILKTLKIVVHIEDIEDFEDCLTYWRYWRYLRYFRLWRLSYILKTIKDVVHIEDTVDSFYLCWIINIFRTFYDFIYVKFTIYSSIVFFYSYNFVFVLWNDFQIFFSNFWFLVFFVSDESTICIG